MAAVRQPSPPLSNYKKSISICLSEDMVKRLRLHSMNINVSQSKIVESALNALFDLYDSSQKELKDTEADHRLGITCEIKTCKNSVTHAEYYYNTVRTWCEQHVPMSGHYNDCPSPCKKLLGKLRLEEIQK